MPLENTVQFVRRNTKLKKSKERKFEKKLEK